MGILDTRLLVSVAVPVGLGGVAGLMTRGATQSEWYTSLAKPSWQPPGYVFGPVWTVLYVLMGVAFWRVWKAGGGSHPMTLYAVQLGLNIAWSYLFFNAKSLSWALFDIVALLGVLLATVSSFYQVDHTAGYLLLPYLAWVTFAAALTTDIYLKNT